MNSKQLKAMAEGRERARKKRIREAAKRVKAYRAWCDRSAAHMRQERELERRDVSPDEIRRKAGPIPRMPAIPSDADYQLAREAGAIQ